MVFAYLSFDDVAKLHDAALDLGLQTNRDGLLEGLPTGFTSSLHPANTLGAQILRDLQALNAIENLADGTVPLVIWLQNAKQSSRDRVEHAVFKDALAKVMARLGRAAPPGPTGPAQIAAPAAPPAPWRRLKGAEYGALQAALLDAFPIRSSLEQMLRFQLDKDLNVLAGEGGLGSVVFAVIQDAEAHAWTAALFAGAQRGAPQNQALRDFAQKIPSLVLA